jgi:hypothetical protein
MDAGGKKTNDALDALDGLVAPWYALRDSAVADVVRVFVAGMRTVLPRHDVQGLLRTRGRCAQKGQVARVPEIVICVVVLERAGRGLVVQWRWRRDMHIGEGVGLAWGGRRKGDMGWWWRNCMERGIEWVVVNRW